MFVIVSWKLTKARIYWDGHRSVDIHLAEDFKGKTMGLCGTFNDDSSDDFKDFSGTVRQSVHQFASSYASSDCSESPSDYPDPSCPNDASNCAELEQDSFSKCHSKVNVKEFKDMCKLDACGSNNNAEAVCAILERYSRQCAMKGEKLTWRRDDLCSK